MMKLQKKIIEEEIKTKEQEDGRWMLMEEGYPHTIELLRSDAEELQLRYQLTYPNLEYTLFWDEYYEYSSE